MSNELGNSVFQVVFASARQSLLIWVFLDSLRVVGCQWLNFGVWDWHKLVTEIENPNILPLVRISHCAGLEILYCPSHWAYFFAPYQLWYILNMACLLEVLPSPPHIDTAIGIGSIWYNFNMNLWYCTYDLEL